MSIPHELQQIKAQQIYEQRIAKGKNGSSEGDWETARRYLNRYPNVVRAWRRNQAIAFYQQLPRVFFRRLRRSLKVLIAVIGKIIIFPFWLFYKLPQLFANKDTRPFALDVVKTIISAASLIAAIIAAIGLFVNYQDAIEDRRLTQERLNTDQERLVTNRFSKAVEQIGNSKEEVVIGGIYSLERIAKDSPKDQWTIMEILTAFVRKNSPITPEIQELEEGSEEKLKALEKLDPVKIEIQAALTVIGRREQEQDYTSDKVSQQNTKRLDLSNSNLRSADLRSANLRSANLSSTNLSSTNLYSANLIGADLTDTNFTGADLSLSYLSRANFTGARLTGTNFTGADLSLSYLSRANFTDARLTGARLTGAYLTGADLTSARLSGAYLTGADLTSARLSNAYLISTDLTSARLSNAYLFGTYLSSADFFPADLDNVENPSNEKIKSACFWEEAIYSDAEWNDLGKKWIVKDKIANQKRIEAIKQDKASDPANPPDCNIWKF